MTEMRMGSNIALPVLSVRATLRWTAGPGVPEVDASALLLGEDGEVGSDADFVFYNQPQHYSGAVWLAGKTPAPQASESIDMNLAAVPADYQRVVLAASADGGTFGQVPDLQVLLSDTASGQPIAVFPMQAQDQTAFVSAEIYRRDGGWKVRAIGQGYSSGLAGLAADFGIDVGAAETVHAAPPPVPAPPVPAPPVAPPPAAPLDQPVAMGLDLSGGAGVGLFLPVTNDLGPDFSPVPAPLPPTLPQQPPPTSVATPLGASLQKNERVELAPSTSSPLNRVVFSLGWTPVEGFSEVDLDASVIAFDQNAEKLAIVWYMHTNEFYGALQHTGDNRRGGTGGDAEQILVDLTRLPANVLSLVFTINSFRKQTFTDVANAFCAVVDGETGTPLVRFDLSDTQPSTALLMAELRRGEQPGTWRMRAIGEFHDHRTVRKLVPAAARQVRIG
jgi:stress response protein SCP2